MKELILVALGGAIGSASRFGIGSLFQSKVHDFPWQTFWVNIIGSFIAGFVTDWIVRSYADNSLLRSFLVIGFCGGFTTFSSFSLEIIKLYKNGDTATALVYVFTSLIFGLLAVITGISLSLFFNKN